MDDASHFPFRHNMAFARFASGGLAGYKTGDSSTVVMTFTPSAFAAFLDAQRADYRNSLPQRLAQIESLWRQVLNDERSAETLATLERCAHSLAGSGATFGFADLGDAARALELAVNPLLDSACALTVAAQTKVSQAIESLQRSLSGES